MLRSQVEVETGCRCLALKAHALWHQVQRQGEATSAPLLAKGGWRCQKNPPLGTGTDTPLSPLCMSRLLATSH